MPPVETTGGQGNTGTGAPGAVHSQSPPEKGHPKKRKTCRGRRPSLSCFTARTRYRSLFFPLPPPLASSPPLSSSPDADSLMVRT